MAALFNYDICGCDSWGEIFQKIEIWEPLIHHIFAKEKLRVSKIENLSPGTNAVFKSGDYVVKIFAPKESGFDVSMDYATELYSLSFVRSLKILTPKIITHGIIRDTYDFSYIIMEFIKGVMFDEASLNFTDNEKYFFAKRLREITDLFNKPCEDFNGIDVLLDQGRYRRWSIFTEKFRDDRLEYLHNHNFGTKVFVHGDLCGDNLIIDNKNCIYILDFADSVLAPIVYEHAHLATVLFGFNTNYLNGFFGKYSTNELVDLCFDGLLMHDFGADIIREKIAASNELTCLNDLRKKLYKLIE